MRNFWIFTPWYRKEDDMERLARSLRIPNSEQLFRAGFGPQLDPKSFPVVDLRIGLEDFDNDCFMWESRTFVSERLRAAMNLDPAKVQYFEVDATRSAAKPRAMGYQVMNVPVLEDAADLAKSKYSQSPPLSPDLPPMRHAHEIHIRDDFETEREIFVDSAFFHWFCTDALALRVLQSGCTGVRFIDPGLPIGNRMRFRTLRGVEADEWDQASDDFVRRVVEPVH
jgi:hypothetical protein